MANSGPQNFDKNPLQELGRAPSRRLWFWRIGGMLTVISVAATGLHLGWHWAAGELSSASDRAISIYRDKGREIACADRKIQGYPFRVGVFCSTTGYKDNQRGVRFQAGALRSAAQFYAPGKAVFEMDSPASIEAPGLVPMELAWSSLRASANANLDGFQNFSAQVKALRISDGWAAAGPILASIEEGQFHLRRSPENGQDSDFALRLSPIDLAGSGIAPFAIDLDMSAEMIAQALRPGFSLRDFAKENGLRGTIRQLAIMPETGGRMTVSGRFDIDVAGRLSGKFMLKASEPGKLKPFLVSVLPGAQDVINMVASLAAALSGSKQEQSVVIVAENGAVRAGLIPLVQLPPLF